MAKKKQKSTPKAQISSRLEQSASQEGNSSPHPDDFYQLDDMPEELREMIDAYQLGRSASQEGNSFPRPYAFYQLDDMLTAKPEELREMIDAYDTYIANLSASSYLGTYSGQYLAYTQLRRATAYGMLREWDRALADLNQIIELGAEVSVVNMAHHIRAGVYTGLEQHDLAIADHSRTLAVIDQAPPRDAKYLVPIRVKVALSRGKLYAIKGRYEEAFADFDTVLAHDPINAEAYSSRGLAYGYYGNLPQALADCNRAVELEQVAFCYHRRGVVLCLHKDFRRALADLDQALALDPDNEYIQRDRRKAVMLMHLGRMLGVLPEEQYV